MRILKRSLRSLLRSPMRTLFTVVLLAVSIGLALIMLTINGAFQNQLDSLKANVGTDIQVRPAGSYALLGGGEPIQEADIGKISSLPHVVSVQRTAQALYTGNSLVSSINIGRLGRRATSVLGGQFSQMPIVTMGFEPSNSSLVLLGGASANIQSGRYFSSNESDANVAVIGQALAKKNNLDLGSKVSINGTEVNIIGIFNSGQAFGDSIMILPFDTEERLFNLSGATSLSVQADTIQNVSVVASSISQTLGADNVDVVTSEDTYQRISSSLVNASQTSQTGMIAAFIVAAAIILFSVFLSVRQRTKEIGILKAIGASNFTVGLQFGFESLEISLIATILGLILTFPLAKTVGRLLVITQRGPGGGALGGAVTRVVSFAGIQLTVSPVSILYALLTAILLAVLASMLSAWYVGRVKPAEVLRNE